jgi:hypothetical protein
MRAQEFVTEAFDRPYAMKWEHGNESHDALVLLPEGGYLSIMFSLDHPYDSDAEEWHVEFYRNNSQEVTGEGDQQRIFATVLEAIKQFVEMKHPETIRFSASKEPEADMAEPGANVNPLSRTKLYNRLVQRYASSLGYQVEISDFGGSTVYHLFKLNESVAEQQLDELSFLGSECTTDCSGHRAGYDWSKRKGLRQANSLYSPSFNKGSALAVAGK